MFVGHVHIHNPTSGNNTSKTLFAVTKKAVRTSTRSMKQDQHDQRNQCIMRLPAALNIHNSTANARQTILGNNWLLKTANSGAGGPGGGIGDFATGGKWPKIEHCCSSKAKAPAGSSIARSSDQISQATKPVS